MSAVRLYEVFHTHGRIVAVIGQPKDETKVRVVDLHKCKDYIIPRATLEQAGRLTARVEGD